jgi:transmembrane sensor
MTKEEFQDLLQRYTAGTCSHEEIKEIDRWFAKISADEPELQAWEKEHIHRQMRDRIREALPSAQQKKDSSNNAFLFLKVAAGLLILALVTYLGIHRTFSVSDDPIAFNPSGNDNVHQKNSTTDILLIRLPDSSRVELKPDAEISYSRKWQEEKREVHLVGEAFFDVVKDSKRPFYVYGGEIITKVLGTSFSVNAAKDAKSIQVSVRTGKVSVYEDDRAKKNNERRGDGSGVVLTPNEKVEFFVTDKHWVTSLVDEPLPFPAIDKASEFLFSNTPLQDIIQSIEKAYAIDVVIENDALNNCTFTGDVSAMELYDMLNVICKTTGNNYEVKGTKILITGKGCN